MRLFRKNVDMTEGVVWKQMLLFALPLILGDFLQQLYSAVDSVIVGQAVGTTALAAVTSTETLINTIIGLFSGISAGATIVIARFFGARDDENISTATHTVFVIALAMGLLMTAVGVIFSPLLLRLLNTPDDVFEEAATYLRIYFCGMLGLVIYNMISGILRAIGDSVRPLIALAITSCINIVLDLLFVVVFKMGVAGAAWATILAICVSALYLLILLMRSKNSCRLEFRKLTYDRKIAKQVYGIGVPMGLQKSIVAFSNLLVIAHINQFGSAASAGWGVYRKVDTLVMNVINNIGQAMSTFVSQNLGAGKQDRIRAGSRFGILFNLFICIVLDGLLLIFREPIIRIFDGTPEVLYYGGLVFLWSLPFQPVNAITHALGGVIRGYGDSRGPVLLTLLCMVVLRQIYLNVGWAYLPRFEFAVSCYPFAWFMNMILLVIYAACRGVFSKEGYRYPGERKERKKAGKN